MRADNAIIELFANPRWLGRIMQISDEWKQPDVVLVCFRTVRLITRSNAAYETMQQKFPALSSYLIA
jgi:hypothetical protein